MSVLEEILSYAAAGQLLVILGSILRSRLNADHAYAASGLTATTIVYLLADSLGPWEGISWPMMASFAALLPIFFWLMTRALFEDRFRWSLTESLILLSFYGLMLLQSILFPQDPPAGSWLDFVEKLWPQAPALIFVLLALLVAFRSGSEDLIDSRIRFRSLFIGITASIIFGTLVVELAMENQEAPELIGVFQKLVISGIVTWFSISRLDFIPGFMPEKAENPEAVQKPVNIDEAVGNKLAGSMQAGFYKTDALTIGQLAEHLEIKEYRLRQVINQQLGYRNFSDYLNSYRIREACRILEDPKESEKTVLEIAYGLGYASLSPFNRAFKSVTGMTPTAWRKKNRS
jgi:AraC-like DNA-binding protein